MFGFAFLLTASCVFCFWLSHQFERYSKSENENVTKSNQDYLGIPGDAKLLGYFEGIPTIDSVLAKIDKNNIARNKYQNDLYIWIEGSSLKYQLSILSEYKHEAYELMKNTLEKNSIRLPHGEINLDDIIVFGRLGDMYTSTSGGGSDLEGAIWGGIIAGGAGAIIGSRKSISTSVVDKRQTVLTYKATDGVRSVFFESDDYSTLLRLLPDKEMSIVASSKQQQQEIPISSDKTDIGEKIEKLKDLQGRGIISEEEYNERRKQLLDKFTDG